MKKKIRIYGNHAFSFSYHICRASYRASFCASCHASCRAFRRTYSGQNFHTYNTLINSPHNMVTDLTCVSVSVYHMNVETSCIDECCVFLKMGGDRPHTNTFMVFLCFSGGQQN